jgi:hypothetical protein
MKLCPQCEFIYEDDQSICDMDGKELVYDPGPLAFEGSVRFTSPELYQTAPLPVSLASLPKTQPTRWQSRTSAVAALAAIILAALLFVVYYARFHQPRSANENQVSDQTSIQSEDQSTQVAADTQEPTSELAPEPSESLPLTPSSDESSSTSENVTTSSPSSVVISSTSLNRGRMTNPVSAGGSVPDRRGPVTVWLTNGASIRADEVWEKREGIWYRQAGVVTFLNRSQVKAIQRLNAPNSRPKSPAINSQGAIAQNRPRIVKPEVAGTKKESKVTSFLKRTGRILKKPFKL